ncbi:hypothetical protein [Synechococcus sp. Cruz CV-v-12]|uniref:hypothetical protein n=1 Tax=Synechococcus sp. Cruz CV-v-12 TaxID=2823728 RepID=UPI0020CC4F6C|nr:hypothetical protein [Synechococcus sp. Cruz CV-v-12]MCP9874376.1 hypothetical protein [Synechococcus sp. Cruz CV-v-12]
MASTHHSARRVKHPPTTLKERLMTRSHIAPRVLATLATLATLALSLTAHAQVWNEVGDAGQNGVGAAQVTVGAGALTTINGSLFRDQDVDLYCIRITDFANFRAIVTASTNPDSTLHLFNPDGTLQVYNDDYFSGSGFSLITSQGVFANGTYFLAMANYDNRPRSVSNTDLHANTVWPGPQNNQVQGNGLVLSSWAGDGVVFFGLPGAYTIELQGAEFHFIPAPSAAAMLGLGGLMAARRRRS